MQLPGVIGAGYLVVMLIVIPRGAIQSRRLLREADPSGQPVLSRRQILLQSIINLAILGVMTAVAAWSIGYDPLRLPERFGVTEMAIGVGALVLTGIGSWLSRRASTEEERKNLAIYRWMPQDGRERALFVVSALLAGTVEEAAYRGVLVEILSSTTGNGWVAVLISALAFAVGHAVQGLKSAVVVFLVALVMQGIVFLTGTLLVAMAVHAAYDVVAGIMAGNTARKLASESGAAAG